MVPYDEGKISNPNNPDEQPLGLGFDPDDAKVGTQEQKTVEKQLTPEQIEKEKKYYGLSMEEQYQLIGEQLKNREGKKNDSLRGKEYKTFDELCDDLQGRTVVEGSYGGFYRLRSSEIIAGITHLQKQVEEELNTKPWEEIMQKLGYFGNSYETLEKGMAALVGRYPELERLNLRDVAHSFERTVVQERMKREGFTSEEYQKLWQEVQDRRHKSKAEPKKGEPKKRKGWFSKS